LVEAFRVGGVSLRNGFLKTRHVKFPAARPEFPAPLKNSLFPRVGSLHLKRRPGGIILAAVQNRNGQPVVVLP
jgi:hypothetical protein